MLKAGGGEEEEQLKQTNITTLGIMNQYEMEL
jgi:hypothetical protein